MRFDRSKIYFNLLVDRFNCYKLWIWINGSTDSMKLNYRDMDVILIKVEKSRSKILI
jgi:hypothetical protein